MIPVYQKTSPKMKTKPSKGPSINAVTFSLCYLVIFLIIYPLFLHFLLFQGNPQQITKEDHANQINESPILVKEHRATIKVGGSHGVYLPCHRKSDQATYDYIHDEVVHDNECADDEIFITSALLSEWNGYNGTSEASAESGGNNEKCLDSLSQWNDYYNGTSTLLASRCDDNENCAESTFAPEEPPNLLNEVMPSRNELSFFYVQ